MTRKLYYDAIEQRTFDARLLRQETSGGRTRAVLDQTLFYPGGGGQPCDLGTLNGVPVTEVYEEEGEIVHVLDGSLEGEQVRGEIDWPRRFELMQQHLGQHILSAVFVRDFGLNTVGLRLERDALWIDLDGYVREEAAAQAEAAANEVLYEDLPVRILFPDREEISRRSKRPIPQTDQAIRIVEIGELDFTPCCGLQNQTTGQVGLIKIQRLDTHKSGSRIHFLCGRPALRWVCALCGDAARLLRELNCAETELAERVLRQQKELRELKDQRQALLGRLARARAAELLQQAPRVGEVALVRLALPETTQEEMKLLFACLTEQKGVAAVLGGRTGDGAFLLFGCNKAEKRVDVRPAFREAIAGIGGRGGGGACCAQGFGPDAERLEEILTAAVAQLEQQLQA